MVRPAIIFCRRRRLTLRDGVMGRCLTGTRTEGIMDGGNLLFSPTSINCLATASCSRVAALSEERFSSLSSWLPSSRKAVRRVSFLTRPRKTIVSTTTSTPCPRQRRKCCSTSVTLMVLPPESTSSRLLEMNSIRPP